MNIFFHSLLLFGDIGFYIRLKAPDKFWLNLIINLVVNQQGNDACRQICSGMGINTKLSKIHILFFESNFV